MSSLSIKTYIPTLSSYAYCSEIKNIDFLNINKLINLNDDDQLQKYLNSFTSQNLNSFDNLFCILNLRVLCIGDEIRLLDRETNVNINIDLKNILDRLLGNVIKPLDDFNVENIKIKFKLPSKLYYSNFIEQLVDITQNFYINEDIDYSDLTLKDKLKILSRLKKVYILKIKEHLNKCSEKYKIADLENYTNTTFNFYDNSVFEYVKFLFRVNISSLYNKLYICSQKLNLSYSDFNSLTPSETDLLLAIYKNSNSIK